MIIPDFNFEKSLLAPDCRFLLGIDEVGRGPLAGPVAIGAFLLDLANFDLDFFIFELWVQYFYYKVSFYVVFDNIMNELVEFIDLFEFLIIVINYVVKRNFLYSVIFSY